MQKKTLTPSCVRNIACLWFTLAAFAFVYLRGQDRNWDLLNYHYYAGYLVLNGRHLVDVAAAGFQSFFNPMVYAPGYLSLTYLAFPFSSWSILTVQLLSIPAVILMAREIGRDLGYPSFSFAEGLALLLCVIAPVWWSELGTTFSSSLTAPMILWGIYLILKEFKTPLSLKISLTASGFLFGLAAGLKLTNAPFAVAAFLALLCLVCCRGWRESARQSFFFAVGGISGFSVTSWWYLHLWDEWKNPVFPLYNAVFKSPFYAFINFRDMRWHFSDVPDFLTFIVQSAAGTVKTSEIAFADARIPVIAVLILAAVLYKPTQACGRRTVSFLVFVLSGTALWAVLFAYQRYLIPVELVFGLVIWVLLRRIVKQGPALVTVMVCLTALAVSVVKIPDWGHAGAKFGSNNPFSIEKMEDPLLNTPAAYLVVIGEPPRPISFLLPFLHPDSIFYGIETYGFVKDIIAGKMAVPPTHLPLRIIASHQDADTFHDQMELFGYDPAAYGLACTFIKTGAGTYIACQAVPFAGQEESDRIEAAIDFSKPYHSGTKGISWECGLSHPEPWGRWSDSDLVEFGLTRCLPPGTFELSVTGHAFGPNIGRQAVFGLGSMEYPAVFDESTGTVSVFFVNHDPCVRKLSVRIPEPASPLALGLSSDPRTLGIGFVRMKLLKKE